MRETTADGNLGFTSQMAVSVPLKLFFSRINWHRIFHLNTLCIQLLCKCMHVSVQLQQLLYLYYVFHGKVTH